MVLLIGDQTRAVAAQKGRFLFYEVETIKNLDLPVVFVNLNQSRDCQSDRMPQALVPNYTISVSFQPRIIQFALEGFVDSYSANRRTKSGLHYYKTDIYKQVGL